MLTSNKNEESGVFFFLLQDAIMNAIAEFNYMPEECPGELRWFVVTQTLKKEHQQTHKE